MQEHVKFGSGGGHDDQVDTTVHALRHLCDRQRRGGGGVAATLYYDRTGQLVAVDDEPGPLDDDLSAREVYARAGWRDPLAGGADEFDELDEHDD